MIQLGIELTIGYTLILHTELNDSQSDTFHIGLVMIVIHKMNNEHILSYKTALKNTFTGEMVELIVS